MRDPLQPTSRTDWHHSEIKRLQDHVDRIKDRLPAYKDRRPSLAKRAMELVADLEHEIKVHIEELRKEEENA